MKYRVSRVGGEEDVNGEGRSRSTAREEKGRTVGEVQVEVCGVAIIQILLIGDRRTESYSSQKEQRRKMERC